MGGADNMSANLEGVFVGLLCKICHSVCESVLSCVAVALERQGLKSWEHHQPPTNNVIASYQVH